MYGTPNEIRTRVTCVKGGCPRPLDDGSLKLFLATMHGLEPQLRVLETRVLPLHYTVTWWAHLELN